MSTGDLIASMPTPAMPGGGSDDDKKQGMLYDIVQQLRDDFRERDSLYSAYDTVLFQENEVQIPDNYRKTALEVKSPLAPPRPTAPCGSSSSRRRGGGRRRRPSAASSAPSCTPW